MRELRQWLQDILYCITDAHLEMSPQGFDPSSAGARPHTISLGQLPLPLDGPARIALTVDHHYRIVRRDTRGRWRIQTAAYYYAFDAQDGGEIIAYHWHPGEGGTDFPHLHVSRRAVDAGLLAVAQRSPLANALRPDLANAHLPTGRIALEDVVYLAIQQFGVPARRGRWLETLRESRAAFERARSWHDWPPTGAPPV